jgi:acyl-CoA synthetase (AMP-forming)/AMP-acid ligase II
MNRLVRPATLRRLWESRLLDPRRALVRALPWIAGRAASLGIVSTLNGRALGSKEALSDRSGSLTWRELDARAERAALAIERSGGSTVATLLRNGREQVEVILGAQKAGAPVAPLNTWAKPKELATALEQLQAELLVYDTKHADQLGEAAPQAGRLVHVGHSEGALRGSIGYESLLGEQEPRRLPPFTLRRRPPRILIHTSGTSGKPKGAARRSGASELGAFFGLLSVVPFRQSDVIVCPAPLFHSFGLLTATIAVLLGATLVLPERFDPEELLASIEHHRATAASLVPVMVRRVVSLPRKARSHYDLSSLRIVMTSGSAMSEELRGQAREVFGDVLYDLYGSTEAGWVAIATPEDMARRPSTVGRPVPGVDVAILSPEGQELAAGQTGELNVRAGATFEGYLGGEGRGGNRGYVALGDLGRLDEEDYLHVEGRADDMVVIGGENVYPVEVEEVILGIAGVHDAAVIGVDDPEYGQVLAAFVVGPVDPETVRQHCDAHLASFKVPRRVEVVDELPRTGTGKVRKKELLGRTS